MKKIILLILFLFMVGCKKKTTSSNKSLYKRLGDNIYFGTYPTSLVTDKNITNKLNKKINNKPTSNSLNGWNSYEYYASNEKKDYMFYKDIELDSNKYRAIYLSNYRPRNISYGFREEDSYQDDNGFELNTIYYFKYEEIKWDILEDNGSKLKIISSYILDSQEYNQTEIDQKYIENSGLYVNNYELSFIRKWLNDSFYNLAFNSFEKEMVLKMEIDNSGKISTTDINDAASNNTFDYVSLLSYTESYEYYTYEEGHYYCKEDEKRSSGTDYAFSQGLYLSTLSYSNYRLRTPSPYQVNHSYYVDYDGAVHGDGNMFKCYVSDTSFGIRPVITIKIDNK